MPGPKARRQIRGVMRKAGPFHPLVKLDPSQVVDRRRRSGGRSKRAI